MNPIRKTITTPKTFTETTPERVTQETPVYIINVDAVRRIIIAPKTFTQTTIERTTQATPEYNILDEVPYPTEAPPGDVAPDEEKPTKKKTSWNLKFILHNLHREINEYLKPMTVPQYKEHAAEEFEKYNIKIMKIKEQFVDEKNEITELTCEAFRNEDEETGQEYLNIIDGMEKEHEKKLKLEYNETYETINKLKKLLVRLATQRDSDLYLLYFNWCKSDTMPNPFQSVKSEIDFIYNMMYADYASKKCKNCAQNACVEAQKFINKLNKKMDDCYKFTYC